LLFHPEKPVGFWRFRIQGLIPARKEEMAVRMFNVVTRYITKEDISEVLQDAIKDGSIRSVIKRGIMAELRKLPFSGIYLDALASVVERLAAFIEGLVVREFGVELARELANRVSLRKRIEANARALVTAINAYKLRYHAWPAGDTDLSKGKDVTYGEDGHDNHLVVDKLVRPPDGSSKDEPFIDPSDFIMDGYGNVLKEPPDGNMKKQYKITLDLDGDYSPSGGVKVW